MTGYDALMQEVCVDQGWCGSVVNGKPMHVDFFIPDEGFVTADQFVDWLFMAEGLDPEARPEYYAAHKKSLRAAFVRHMGNDVVEAGTLKGTDS